MSGSRTYYRFGQVHLTQGIFFSSRYDVDPSNSTKLKKSTDALTRGGGRARWVAARWLNELARGAAARSMQTVATWRLGTGSR